MRFIISIIIFIIGWNLGEKAKRDSKYTLGMLACWALAAGILSSY